MNIGGILLAAGGSSRLGQPKQLVRFLGESLLRRAARTLAESRLRTTVVVLGAGAEACTEELAGLPVHVVHNVKWESGVSSSLRLGLEALQQAQTIVDAFVISHCDQPLQTPTHIDHLIEMHLFRDFGIVASEYLGHPGTPALFASQYFPALFALEGDRGAEAIIAANPESTGTVPFPAGAVGIDTDEDLSALG